MSNGNWTVGEMEFLRSAPEAGLSMTEVAARLGKTHGAVKTKASAWEIRFPRHTHGSLQRPWGEDEDRFLRELAPTTPYHMIAEQLDRSRAAVNVRAFVLGIQGRARNERMRGKDHPNWRGGCTEQRLDRGADWPEFRAAAMERDGFTCQDCGVFAPSGKGLVVHHVIPWRLRKVNELRWLTTLCVADHLRRPEHWWREIPEELVV